MKTKTLLATLALIVAPSIALATGCGLGHTKAEQVVMSCAEGSVFDSETQRCVPTTG
ncbi:MAG: carbohydrate-binding module family 14 protein [Boseongicola sp.]